MRWKEFIETPEIGDHDEEKTCELQRLITLWRTSEKRTDTYRDMEHMEVDSLSSTIITDMHSPFIVDIRSGIKISY